MLSSQAQLFFSSSKTWEKSLNSISIYNIHLSVVLIGSTVDSRSIGYFQLSSVKITIFQFSILKALFHYCLLYSTTRFCCYILQTEHVLSNLLCYLRNTGKFIWNYNTKILNAVKDNYWSSLESRGEHLVSCGWVTFYAKIN